MMPTSMDQFLSELKKHHSPEARLFCACALTLTTIYRFCCDQVKIVYDKSRDSTGVIQMMLRQSHCDLWLNKAVTTPRSDYIESRDYTTRNPFRDRAIVFPLRKVNWLGTPVNIPADAHTMMRLEFGSDFLTPRLSSFECFEQIWNRRIESTWWILMVLSFYP